MNVLSRSVQIFLLVIWLTPAHFRASPIMVEYIDLADFYTQLHPCA